MHPTKTRKQITSRNCISLLCKLPSYCGTPTKRLINVSGRDTLSEFHRLSLLPTDFCHPNSASILPRPKDQDVDHRAQRSDGGIAIVTSSRRRGADGELFQSCCSDYLHCFRLSIGKKRHLFPLASSSHLGYLAIHRAARPPPCPRPSLTYKEPTCDHRPETQRGRRPLSV